jgi:hypothetical protein
MSAAAGGAGAAGAGADGDSSSADLAVRLCTKQAAAMRKSLERRLAKVATRLAPPPDRAPVVIVDNLEEATVAAALRAHRRCYPAAGAVVIAPAVMEMDAWAAAAAEWEAAWRARRGDSSPH